MNRFYLFNTWVLIFFIVLTGLFFVASCFYLFQLWNLDKKNRKRFKKQHPEAEDQRKRTYERNLKLAAKLEAGEILASAVNRPELKSKPPKKVKRNVDDAKTRSSLCFDALFKTKKKSQTQPSQYSPKEESYFSEIQTYADQLDGQAQSYESFETMTTDSECYRDWRHSIDFMSNGVLSLNQYNNHNNEIMQKAYEQLYAQRHRTSSSSLCKPPKDALSMPVMSDLYPVSVEPIVPYEYEPQSIHAYQMHAQVHNDEEVFQRISADKTADDLLQRQKCKIQFKADDQRYKLEDEQLESTADGKSTGLDATRQPNNFLNDHNEKNKVNKRSVNETINKLNTLVSVRNDGKIKVLSETDSKSNLDRNMNLLKNESTAVQM